MSLIVEGRLRQGAQPLCSLCGSPLYPTIVGPRCPIHGAEGAR